MDSRERVLLSLSFQQPDRIPVDFWASAGFWRGWKNLRGMTKDEFLDLHDVDFRYIAGPTYVGPRLTDSRDIWGVQRRTIEVPTGYGTETYAEVAQSLLAEAKTVEDLEAYPHWPCPDGFDYRPVAEQCRAVRDAGRIVVFMGDRLNRIAQLKPAMYLRGVEQILMDLAMNPEIARSIFGRIRRFYNEYLERILTAAGGAIDIVLTGDDFGSQAAPLISPSMWEQFLGEGFAGYVSRIHDAGARCMHHTCGAVTPLVGRFVDRGLDVLQSLQPEAMAEDLPDLKRQFGDRLAFQGGISIQQTLPFGTPEQVRREVQTRAETLGPGGGYIFGTAHNVQADCPPENIDALMAAYREWGVR